MVFEFGKHGQGEHVSGCTLRFGKSSRHVAKVGEALLQMQRNGIVDFCAHATLFEEVAQLVAALHTDHILVKDVLALRKRLKDGHRWSGACPGCRQTCLIEELRVSCGALTAS